jgi:hypothetical protein
VWWLTHDGGVETVIDDEPELPLATRIKLNLLSPFVPEGWL